MLCLYVVQKQNYVFICHLILNDIYIQALFSDVVRSAVMIVPIFIHQLAVGNHRLHTSQLGFKLIAQGLEPTIALKRLYGSMICQGKREHDLPGLPVHNIMPVIYNNKYVFPPSTRSRRRAATPNLSSCHLRRYCSCLQNSSQMIPRRLQLTAEKWISPAAIWNQK